MEWIVAQPTPLGSNPVTDSQTAGSIPELVIILIILLLGQAKPHHSCSTNQDIHS
ncbi:MAG TPA: hypothetical protein V6D50_14450 [Chroococcales cyanobacterium]